MFFSNLRMYQVVIDQYNVHIMLDITMISPSETKMVDINHNVYWSINMDIIVISKNMENVPSMTIYTDNLWLFSY